jgi:RNA polymerase sigma-70 factor (ECF subfamily)
MKAIPDPDRASSDLLEASGTGDSQALGQLLVRHLDDLRAFVRIRMSPTLRGLESHEDLLQSVCTEVLTHPERFSFRGEAEFRSWLYGAVLNKLRSKERMWRMAKRDPRRLDHATATLGSLSRSYCGLGTPSDHLMSAEEVERIEAAFDSLTEEQREVLSLHRFVRQSHAEIATLLGKNEGAVRMTLHRALSRLSTLLDDGDGERAGGSGREGHR